MTDPERGDATERLSPEHAAGLRPEDRELREVPLLLYHREGATLLALTAGMPAVVGRALEADVTLDDRSLSREHARFELREDGAW